MMPKSCSCLATGMSELTSNGAFRANLIAALNLLASAEEQERYQRGVAIDIRDELLCLWFDDFWDHGQRKRLIPLLSAEELRALDQFHAFFEARDNSCRKRTWN